MGNNGVTWPTQCQDKYTEAVFFGIGDWGGMCGFGGHLCHCEKGCPGYPGPGDDCQYKYGKENSPVGLPCTFVAHGAAKNQKIEGQVQKRIGDRMSDRNDAMKKEGDKFALTKDAVTPQFVLNVGDNFYPGGIDAHCGTNDVVDHTMKQFEYVWLNVYKGELTTRMEWWSVLGNHDYGGVCYAKGWDQQILYTYTPNSKWLMPGQYWMRTAQYKNMAIDFFFVDGSWLDTKDGGGGQALNHDICQFNPTVPDAICQQDKGFSPECPGTGPYNGGDCENWFKTLWSKQYEWLKRVVPASDKTAQYQIVVTHYPAAKSLGHAGVDQIDWKLWAPKHGVELVISGHKHFQRVYQGMCPGHGPHGTISGVTEDWSQGTTSVITGGGGGITSDNIQNAQEDGQDDAYGFFEFHATLEKLTITAWSHGGLQNALIVRNSTTVYPLRAKSTEELSRLFPRREITV